MHPVIQFACRTHAGRVRDHNEDYVLAERPSDPAMLASKGTLLIVADGMGGHQAGEVASERAAQTIRREYYSAGGSPDLARRLAWAVQVANVEVHQLAQANPERAGMGAALVAAAIVGSEAHVANVGDSRAYLARGGSIRQITADHSLVAAHVEAGILTPAQARVHPQRNVLTRALGARPTVQADTHLVELQEGDVLVLCSDGLTEHVPEGALLEVATTCEPGQAADRLVELANEGGGSDNISVTVARVEPPHVRSAPRPTSQLDRRLQVAAIAIVALIALALIAAGIWMVGSALASESQQDVQEATIPAPARIGTVEATRVSPTATLRPTWTPEGPDLNTPVPNSADDLEDTLASLLRAIASLLGETLVALVAIGVLLKVTLDCVQLR